MKPCRVHLHTALVPDLFCSPAIDRFSTFRAVPCSNLASHLLGSGQLDLDAANASWATMLAPNDAQEIRSISQSLAESINCLALLFWPEGEVLEARKSGAAPRCRVAF
ncbi:hypothetical protein NXS19_011654 [Fusarium pseudograminearum]|nr:hypothetical protein NXS19_011654 [Fusarium pseudograminearum]